MDALWRTAQPLVVRDVGALFPDLAYTTLLTTLDRLHRKGFVTRRRLGRAYAYRAADSREVAWGRLLSGHLSDAFARARGAPRAAILSALVSSVGQQDEALLDELEDLVRAERRRLGRRSDR